MRVAAGRAVAARCRLLEHSRRGLFRARIIPPPPPPAQPAAVVPAKVKVALICALGASNAGATAQSNAQRRRDGARRIQHRIFSCW